MKGLNLLAGCAILIPGNVTDALITATEASALCGVSPDTIRTWATRKKLDAAGIDHRGRKLYRLLDIAKVDRATKQRARRP